MLGNLNGWRSDAVGFAVLLPDVVRGGGHDDLGGYQKI
jgi:hypothetical protein